MKEQLLAVKAALQIARPAPDVFEAIADPAKMSNYFISQGSGRLEEGRIIHWKFPEFDVEFLIKVANMEKDKYISFSWENDGIRLLVEIGLTPLEGGSTLVTVTEKERANDEEGIRWLMGNTEGWANFLACLKAYLEFGINLRKGGFDYLKK